MLAAGRLKPFEASRLIESSGLRNPPIQQGLDRLALVESIMPVWYEIESAIGTINRLAYRADLQIKVTERLRALFGRNIHLDWPRGRLNLQFSHKGSKYLVSQEASGLLHLVAILAALYDDELAAVLIDEPGISLHPQHQAFLLREMERVAGDPSHGKKIIICATHAPAMVRLRQPTDLCDIAFFSDIDTPPVQVNPAEGALQNPKLGAFVRSLGASHREALFAARPLLVEGPSDAIVVAALDDALGVNLNASGGQIVQAVGKGSMPTILKLLRLIGKKPAAIADLDSITDDLLLVNAFNHVEAGQAAAGTAESLHAAVKPAHDALSTAVTANWADIQDLAIAHSYWKGSDDPDIEVKQKRRAAAAVVLGADPSELDLLQKGTEVWVPLRRRLSKALDLLEQAGLFILRHGTIEDDYAGEADRNDKVGSAATEADAILADSAAAASRHSVAVRALRRVSPSLPIDESTSVRVAFASFVAPAIEALRQNEAATTEALQAASSRHASEVASLFEIERADDREQPTIKVSLSASVLDVTGFPVYIHFQEDVVGAARRAIKATQLRAPNT